MLARATDREGGRHALTFEAGDILMERLRDEGLGVEAVCGGCCACATCHVWVDLAEVPGRGETELELLSASAHFDAARSRLSCQIILSGAHDGLAVIVAPEE